MMKKTKTLNKSIIAIFLLFCSCSMSELIQEPVVIPKEPYMARKHKDTTKHHVFKMPISFDVEISEWDEENNNKEIEL